MEARGYITSELMYRMRGNFRGMKLFLRILQLSMLPRKYNGEYAATSSPVCLTRESVSE